MKITDIRFGMLRVPLKTPFKTALRTVDTIEDIIVCVHTDTGNVGYGEAPATAVITGDTHGSIIEAIKKFISPRIIGEEIANLNRITQLIQGALEKNSSAKAAVEIATMTCSVSCTTRRCTKCWARRSVITTDITITSIHRQDGRGLGRGGGSRLRVLKIKSARTSASAIESVKASTLPLKARTVAARREPGLDCEEQCSRLDARMPAFGWNSWSSR